MTEATLRSEVSAALELASARPTSRNRKALREAQARLDDFMAAQEDAGPRTFGSILEVVDYLDGSGWKISKTSAYDHWKKDGKLRARGDGRFDLAEVDAYARKHLSRKDGSTVGEDLAEEKRREEVLRIRADRQMRDLKYRQEAGELMPRGQVEAELSERATHLRNYLDAVARSSAGRIIKLAGGDPQKAPELIAFLLGMNRKALDNYSRPIDGAEESEEP